MKKIFIVLFCLKKFTPCTAQTIGNFISVQVLPQSQTLVLPSTHSFEMLMQQGDVKNGYTIPPLGDFTGFMPTANSSKHGYLSLNHELINAAITVSNIDFDSADNKWNCTNFAAINATSVAGLFGTCSGTVTPWNTIISGEEYMVSGDSNADGYIDAGWLVESNPITKQAVRKICAAGRGVHENCVINAAQTALYTANDHSIYGFVFKYVFDTPSVDSSGSLYALQLAGTVGTWLPIANTTISDRNNSFLLAQVAGATNFNGVEDVEINPFTNAIYFTSKAYGNIYKFTETGLGVSGFDTVVTNTQYNISTDSGIQVATWGLGIDNLAFDNEGNLWALQDGGNNNIWMIAASHTKTNPQVHLFATVPSGAEPTGLTFTPDNKYMFLTMQHPYATNTALQQDAFNNVYTWNKTSTIVIARNENLGVGQPLIIPIKDTVANSQTPINLIPHLEIIPHPFTEKGIVNFKNYISENTTTLLIINLLGQQVRQIQIPKNTAHMPLASMSAGTYKLIWLDAQQQLIAQKTMVVK